MFGWLRELIEIRRTPKYCESCEVLKVELANERREKLRLLDHVLTPAGIGYEPKAEESGPPRAIMPRHIPWRVKQQELEAKDRAEHDRIMREFKARTGITPRPIQAVPIPADEARSENVANLEKKLGVSDAG